MPVDNPKAEKEFSASTRSPEGAGPDDNAEAVWKDGRTWRIPTLLCGDILHMGKPVPKFKKLYVTNTSGGRRLMVKFNDARLMMVMYESFQGKSQKQVLQLVLRHDDEAKDGEELMKYLADEYLADKIDKAQMEEKKRTFLAERKPARKSSKKKPSAKRARFAEKLVTAVHGPALMDISDDEEEDKGATTACGSDQYQVALLDNDGGGEADEDGEELEPTEDGDDEDMGVDEDDEDGQENTTTPQVKRRPASPSAAPPPPPIGMFEAFARSQGF